MIFQVGELFWLASPPDYIIDGRGLVYDKGLLFIDTETGKFIRYVLDENGEVPRFEWFLTLGKETLCLPLPITVVFQDGTRYP